MLKNKRSIITIAIIVVILICVVLGVVLLNSNTKRDIAYINENKGAKDKIAFIINGNDSAYAVTVDGQYNVDSLGDFFERDVVENDFVYGIEDAVYNRAYIYDDNVSIDAQKMEMYDMSGSIINQDDRWLLIKGEDSSYTIYYCMDKELNIQTENEFSVEEPISLGTIYDVEENEAIAKYEQIKTITNVYKAKENEGVFEFEDYKGDLVDLSEYHFMRDLIVKSLFEYDLYIRDSKGIKESFNETEVLYEVPEDENKTKYEISICNGSYVEETKKAAAYTIDYALEYNDRVYEIETTELGESLNFFTQIGEDSYIHIFMSGEDINSKSIQENIEIFVERIKEQLL